jgi:hypothetical protein
VGANGPDKAIQTAWQRAYAKYLRRHGEDESRIDLKVAEFSFEVWPDTRPPLDPDSLDYQNELRRRADQFRANSANFKEWLDSAFPTDDHSAP